MELTSTHIQLDLSSIRVGSSSPQDLTYTGTTTLTFSSNGSGSQGLKYCSGDCGELASGEEGEVGEEFGGTLDTNDGTEIPPGTMHFGSSELGCHWDTSCVSITSISLKQGGKKALKVGKVEAASERAQPSSSAAALLPPQQDFHYISVGGGALFPVEMYGATMELTISFKASVNTKALEGIYFGCRETTSFGGKVLLPSLICTQFEVYNARKAFPCLDFPFVKSKVSWQVTAYCTKDAQRVPFLTSNNLLVAPENRTGGGEECCGKRNAEKNTITFATEPTETLIPMYVAAFALCYSPVTITKAIAGDTFPLPLNDNADVVSTFSSSVDALPLRVISLEGSPFPHKFAMKILEQSLQIITRFFNLSLCVKKLDLIAIPKMTLGGMEHESVIFLNETVATGSGRASAAQSAIDSDIARLIVHEVTHHWVGNWIGCPFGAKEGVCQILEESIGDVVLGLPMRKRKPGVLPSAGSGSGEKEGKGTTTTTTTTTGGGGGVAAAAPVEEGKELTGHTYQLALAATANAVAKMGFKTFQQRMAVLVGQSYDTYVGWKVFRETVMPGDD